MIDYDNTRFNLLFRMSPPHRWQEFEGITFDAVPDILEEMWTWQDSCNKSWGNVVGDDGVACMMSVTAVYGPSGPEYIAEQESEEAEEILEELLAILYSCGYDHKRETPLILNNAELHSVQVYFN